MTETSKEQISPDDLQSLQFLLSEFEKAQYAVQSLQKHIAAKYQLRNGDSVDIKQGGAIVRASTNGQGSAIVTKDVSAAVVSLDLE